MKNPPESFEATLALHGLELRRERCHTLQVNVGLVCDLACRHCHLEAGPGRPERMSSETMDQVVDLARRTRPETVDITGGAPELVPGIDRLLQGITSLAGRVILRSNLTALAESDRSALLDLCVRERIVLVASFPSTNAGQAEAQRGEGVHGRSLEMLRRLNSLGYGREGTGLELHLVANPTGAFLPPGQEAMEKKSKRDLERKWGIVFNRLFTFANMPLGRFRRWLETGGNFESYMERLRGNFNPGAVEGLMCRSLVSVSWDGYLYDCDFNLATGIGQGNGRTHISGISDLPGEGVPIATGEHCFACTAGSGFT